MVTESKFAKNVRVGNCCLRKLRKSGVSGSRGLGLKNCTCVQLECIPCIEYYDIDFFVCYYKSTPCPLVYSSFSLWQSVTRGERQWVAELPLLFNVERQ